MSGANIPYQLRPNKYVERQLFAELLSRLDRAIHIADYGYVSMGGRLMEDFKLINSRFGIERLISIEKDRVAYSRQRFNRPLAFIECLCIDSEELIDNLDRYIKPFGDVNIIVWLDYAAAKKRGKQLTEYCQLVARLRPYDIVKITLNANIGTLLIEDEVGSSLLRLNKTVSSD